MRLSARWFSLGLALSASVVLALPGWALTRMDAAGVNKALRYGMTQSGMGLMTLLGGNWQEGQEGTLLNIYTPFMVLAAKAARGGYPNSPTDDDVKNARKRYAKTIATIQDLKNPALVKFSVALTGEASDFAGFLKARIEGTGRGRTFLLRPTRQLPQKVATPVPNATIRPYEAINAYYFPLDTLMNMDAFRLILEDPRTPQAEPLVFRIRTDRIE